MNAKPAVYVKQSQALRRVHSNAADGQAPLRPTSPPSPQQTPWLRRSSAQATEPAQQGSAGQALIEAVVALGIVVSSLVGMLYLSSRALGAGRGLEAEIVAANLASEGLEIVKNIVDSRAANCAPPGCAGNALDVFAKKRGEFLVDFRSASFENGLENPLSFDPASRRYGYDRTGGGEPTKFSRALSYEWIEGEARRVRVASKVAWLAASGPREVALEMELLDWR